LYPKKIGIPRETKVEKRKGKPTTAILLDGAMAAPAREEALMAVLNIVKEMRCRLVTQKRRGEGWKGL